MKNDEAYSCDLCSNTLYSECARYSKRLGIDDTKFRVVKCRRCSLKSLYPLPDERDLTEIYRNYAERGEREKVESHRKLHVYPEKLELLKKHAKGKRLLDIGAGIGTFVSLAQEYGFSTTGIEYEREQCVLAKEKLGIDLIQGAFEDVSQAYENRSFDVIHAHHVLEHLTSPKLALQRIHDLLSDNGILLLEVPNQFDNILKEVRYFFGEKTPEYSNPLHHCYFFSPKTIRAYMTQHEFYIISFRQERGTEKTSFFKSKVKRTLGRLGMGTGSMMEFVARKQKG